MKQGDFSEVAKHYHNRPAYSPMLLQKLIACINDTQKPLSELKVAEVGAGTGKLTKMLSEDFKLEASAVEPNDNMRAEGQKFTAHCPKITWSKGSAEQTNLASNAFDWVIMASSFHWSDPKLSLPEFARILKKSNGGGGSYFTILYNPRDIKQGSVFYEIEEEIKHIVPELTRVSSGLQNTKDWAKVLDESGYFIDCVFMECAYKEIWSKERYIGAWHSVNDIQAQAGKERWQEILQMIESKIKPFEELEIPYKIRAWTARRV